MDILDIDNIKKLPNVPVHEVEIPEWEVKVKI